MNKSELIEKVAICAGLTKAQAKRAIDCYHQSVEGALQEGNKVELFGFGSFSVTQMKARTGRNPQTGREIHISSKKVIRFKAGSVLAEKIK